MKTLRFLLPRLGPAVFAALFVASCSEAKKVRLRNHAEQDFKSGNYDKARIEYMNLLRLDPSDATAYERLGLIWSEGGAPLRAAPFLFKTRELAPDNLPNRAKLASVLLSLGELVEARKEATAILRQSPGNEDAIKILAETARTPKEMDESRAQLQKFPKPDSVAFCLASATLALRKGDLPFTEKALQQALALEPKSPSPHLAMASFRLFQNNSVQAGEELKTAAELAPMRSVERLKYAEYKARTGALDEAAEMLKTITKQAPDYLPAWSLLAQIAATNKKYDEALALLENVFGRDSENLDARILQAQTFLAKNEPPKALEVLDRLDKRYPNVAPVRFQLARAHLQNNNPSQAISILTQTVATNPNYLDAVLLLAELNLHSGNAQAVVTSMKELLTKQADLFPAQVLLADGYRSLGRLDEATAVFQERIKLFPQHSQSYLLLGVILRQQNKLDNARRAFAKAQELAPENLMITEQLVELDILAKDIPAATQRVEKELSKNAQSAGAHFIQAKIHVAEGKMDLAEAALQKTLELDPNFARAYDLLISTYLANHKLPQALTQLQALLTKKPDNTPALMLSALIYDKLGDFAKARDAYEKLLASRPDFTPALNNLAYLYSERFNQLDKAYEIARKIRTAQPADPSIADTLGWILYRQGDYQQAVTLLQESASKLPDNPEIQFHLGMASYMMGQSDVARSAFQKAAAATVDFPGKNQIQERLALLGNAPGHELSVAELENLSKQQPSDLLVRIRLGEAYEKQGMSAKAANAYEEALKLNPKLPAIATKLSQLYAGPLKDKDKALGFAKKARELAPNDSKMAGTLGSVAYQIGSFSWAYSLLQESSRQFPDDAAILHDFAWAAYSLGKVSEAEQAMQHALQAAPGSPQSEDAKSFLAMTALVRKPQDLAASEPDVQRVLKADGGNVPALMVQAGIDVQQKKLQPAIEIYTEVLRRFPDFAPAQKQLAALYSEDPADIAKAYDLATKARKTLADDPELAEILAALNYQKKDYKRAIQLFRESSRNRSIAAKSLFYLGMSYGHDNQKAEGVETLNRALAAGLQEPMAAEAKRTIAELQRK